MQMFLWQRNYCCVGGTIKQNQMEFVAGTYDGTKIRAYVDGAGSNC